MNAPNLTAQSSPYLLRQLRHFASEVRGGVADFYGWQMNGRAKALPDDRALRDVVAYIDQLAAAPAESTLKADAAAGRTLYSTCIACHGARAEGNEALAAPALAGLDDWYIVRQLENFRTGSRGKHASDIPGQQMRGAASMLPDETAVRNVAAYIATIK
jgi:cytochrome c oxidase subunit 2